MKHIIAAMADVHMSDHKKGSYVEIFKKLSKKAEVLIIAGDLTDHGTTEEAEMLLEELQACSIPVVMVLGNHDYDKNQQNKIIAVLQTEKTHVLKGTTCIINDIGFAGIKGFGGGFEERMTSPIGEQIMKNFVQESVEDVMKLEHALQELRTEKKIVVMHYSPIKATVEGEPLEIYPFLGCSRLENPINNLKPNIVFHGHAHHGAHEGKTRGNIFVYNVSFPVLLDKNPQMPYALIEV